MEAARECTFAEGPRSLQRLHLKVVSGDRTATDELASIALPLMYKMLIRKHIFLPEEQVEDAVCDAILFYVGSPDRFQPERGALLSFLLAVAENKLRDWHRKHIKRSLRESHVGALEELDLLAVNDRRSGDPSSPETVSELPAIVWELIEEALPEKRDRDAMLLILEGRCSTEELGAALGLLDLPEAQRQAEVKRHRDRITKRLQRRRSRFQEVLYG